MSRSRNMLLTGSDGKRLPTAEEVALRPELVKQLLSTVGRYVDQHDLEHMVAIGITTDGSPRVYHSYGSDLPLTDVAQLLEDLAALTRAQLKENLVNH